MVRVMGPNAVGVPLDNPSVRIINHEPNTITRIPAAGHQPLTPGQRPPMLTFYGLCPNGHRLDSLPLTDDEAGATSAIRPIESRTKNLSDSTLTRKETSVAPNELASVVAAILLSSSANAGTILDDKIKRAVDDAFKILEEAAAPGRPLRILHRKGP